MFSKTMTAIGLAMVTASPVLAVEGPFPVRDIESIAFFESMKNPNALDYYPDVAEDVAAAIRDRVDLADEDTVRAVDLDIRITSMRLNDNPVLTDNGEFNILEGLVIVSDDIGDGVVESLPVILRAEEMDVPYPSTSPDTADFYNAMVLAFADRAVEITEGVTELPDPSEVRN